MIGMWEKDNRGRGYRDMINREGVGYGDLIRMNVRL